MSDLATLLDSMPADVRAERQRRGLSHRSAAEQIGIAYADLCRFELGHKDCRLSTLRAIAAWMNGPVT